MTWLLFIASSFCVFRVSAMITSEEGPAEIFRFLRRKVPPKTNAGRGIRCPFCVSVWISFVLSLAYALGAIIDWPMLPIWAFAMSGVSVILHKWSGL